MKEGSMDGKTISLEEKMAENWMVLVSTEKGIMKWSKKAGEPF